MTKFTLLLFLLAGTSMVQGEDLPGLINRGLKQNLVLSRVKRWNGISLFDSLRGNGHSSVTKPTNPPTSAGSGFNLADALKPGPQTSKPAGGNDSGFKLEDALRPAVKPRGGDDQAFVVQKLNTVIENQNQELHLLQLLANRL